MVYLVMIAGKLLRSRPEQITILGPLVTYFFTLFAGTAQISYSIMSIIAEVAIEREECFIITLVAPPISTVYLLTCECAASVTKKTGDNKEEHRGSF